MSKQEEFLEAREIRLANEAKQEDRIRKRLEACIRYDSTVILSHLAASFQVTPARMKKIAKKYGLEAAFDTDF